MPESGMKLFTISSMQYAVFNALGYIAGGFVFYLEARRRKLSLEKLLYITLAALFGGLLGSRLGSALFVYPQYYQKYPMHIFIPQVGGKTIVGGIILGYVGVLAAKKILKFNRSTGDLFALALAIGIAIGRLGCFLNGCCYGKAASPLWGVMYKGQMRYPVQIYESIFCFLLFLFLWKIRTKVTREGDLFKLFLLFYSFFRFWIEFLRADTVSTVLGISIAQVICFIVFISVAVYFLRRLRSECAIKSQT